MAGEKVVLIGTVEKLLRLDMALLEKNGFEVMTFLCGPQPLEVFKSIIISSQPDVVVTSLSSKRTHTVENLAVLREFVLAGLPVIAYFFALGHDDVLKEIGAQPVAIVDSRYQTHTIIRKVLAGESLD